MAESGTLSVKWISVMVPWATLRVVVDGSEVGRVGYRKPASLDLAAGPHDVVLRRRNSTTHPVRIDMPSNGRVELFGGNSRLPPGMRGYGQIKTWAKESSFWLATQPTDRATSPPAARAEPLRLGDSQRPSWWQSRRRWIPIFVAAAGSWAVAAVRTSHAEIRILDVTLIIGAGRLSYAYWTNPLPPGYAEHLRNQPRFGTKLWHKLAIAFLVAFALLVLAVLVGLVK
jgi:hypothetical protein